MAKVNIQPLGDRVLVKQVEEKEQVKGGSIIRRRFCHKFIPLLKYEAILNMELRSNVVRCGMVQH